jgi:2-keto-3-deoxy-6-phosphogluconate aldolase
VAQICFCFVQDTLIMAAGGVQPQQVRAWLKAGADVVALGTQVLGLHALLVLVQKYTH